MRFCARAISADGVFWVFLMNPCSTPIRPSVTKNISRAIRLFASLLRTSHSPAPERSAQRHCNRPSDLHGREVGPDRLAIFG